MKTSNISKNIILAFIILISSALKLSAHENTTSLISSDNVSIEKDKNEENISKRHTKKIILCYELNETKIYRDYVQPLIYFFMGLLIPILVSHFTDRKRKKTIKKELEGNKDYLTEKYKNVFKELLENNLSNVKNYLEEKGITNAVNFDFDNDYEFCKKFKGLSLVRFREIINEDLKNKNILQISTDETWLNNLLCNPSFYDDIFEKTIKPNISISEEIKDLVKETKEYRGKNFSDLDNYKQYFIKRLNRFLIETAYPKESPNIKVTRLTKDLESDYFIHLSDTSWNLYKYVISDKEYITSKAYMLIGEINALSNASIHTNKDITLPRLAQAIIKAKDAINSAIEIL